MAHSIALKPDQPHIDRQTRQLSKERQDGVTANQSGKNYDSGAKVNRFVAGFVGKFRIDGERLLVGAQSN